MSQTTNNDSTERAELGLGWRLAGRLFNPERKWEFWALLGFGLAFAAVIAWVIVFLRLGHSSLVTYMRIIPLIGIATVPLAVWGVLRSAMATPALTARRVGGFAVLLAVGVVCNVPLFAVPLSTEAWETDRAFRLPFDGEWYTLAGGAEPSRNYHATTPAYRWGYDFAPVRDGSRYQNEGKRLEDYYCWGKPVLAPAGGRVVRTTKAKEDTAPGEFNRKPVLGNHVVIRVEEGVYLFVGHLKKGSVAVEPKTNVEKGEAIGACGSSGQALAPHVHVHLQNGPKFPLAEGLPLRFSNYRTDGERVERGMPKGGFPGSAPEGERVEPLSPSAR